LKSLTAGSHFLCCGWGHPRSLHARLESQPFAKNEDENREDGEGNCVTRPVQLPDRRQSPARETGERGNPNPKPDHRRHRKIKPRTAQNDTKSSVAVERKEQPSAAAAFGLRWQAERDTAFGRGKAAGLCTHSRIKKSVSIRG
jgi:hypothetical protein